MSEAELRPRSESPAAETLAAGRLHGYALGKQEGAEAAPSPCSVIDALGSEPSFESEDEDAGAALENHFEFDFRRAHERYIPGTMCPKNGWFQPCEGCQTMTGQTLDLHDGQERSVCLRCADKWRKGKIALPGTDKPVQAPSQTPSITRHCANGGSSALEASPSHASVNLPLVEYVLGSLDWSCWLGSPMSVVQGGSDASAQTRRRTCESAGCLLEDILCSNSDACRTP